MAGQYIKIISNIKKDKKYERNKNTRTNVYLVWMDVEASCRKSLRLPTLPRLHMEQAKTAWEVWEEKCNILRC